MLVDMADIAPLQSGNTQPDRSFGWWNMFVHPDDDPRTDGGSWGSGTHSSGFCATSG